MQVAEFYHCRLADVLSMSEAEIRLTLDYTGLKSFLEGVSASGNEKALKRLKDL